MDINPCPCTLARLEPISTRLTRSDEAILAGPQVRGRRTCQSVFEDERRKARPKAPVPCGLACANLAEKGSSLVAIATETRFVSETAPNAPALPDRNALAALVEAVAEERNKRAFAQLFTHFAPRIKGYMIRLGAEPAQAEELTQDAMLTVWRKAHTFDRRQASVSTWLFTIARNRRIDMLRRDGRPEFDPQDPLLIPDPEPAPDILADRAGREERLHRAMSELPPEQSDLLRQAFFRGRSHRDIAEDTGIPLGTVKSRLRLAFGRLRKALEEDGAPDSLARQTREID